ncbi:MAG TPA: sigma-70 family RNA polymerase sigma factor [Patescibacteria group bacterium]|nr:sigma-70 family RNA polymerase sigma factor [Patescibacteria group bacterium]
MELEAALQRVRDGDLEAYGTVIELTASRLRAFLALRVPDRDLVDETAHEAYIIAYEKLDQYVPNTNFEAWLRQIAFLLLRNACRRRRATGAGALERLAFLAAPSGPDTLELREDIDRLQHCLDQLEPPARELLDLRYRQRMTPADIASRTGRKAATIRSLLTRLRQILRQCMEPPYAT